MLRLSENRRPRLVWSGAELLLDARDHLALTHRPAVVRAMILVGDDAVALPEDAELEGVDPQHAVAAVRELAELAHHDLVHRFTPSLVVSIAGSALFAGVISIIDRVGRGGTTSADRRS